MTFTCCFNFQKRLQYTLTRGGHEAPEEDEFVESASVLGIRMLVSDLTGLDSSSQCFLMFYLICFLDVDFYIKRTFLWVVFR